MPKRRKNETWAPELQKRLIALAGVVVVVGAALVLLAAAGILGNQGGGEGIEDAVVLDTAPPPGQNLDVGPEAGKLAPDFEISAFDGTRHQLSEFRGKVVYLNFWATWCVPCQIELPDIQQLQALHSEDLVVVTVNRREPLDRAKAYFRNLPLKDGGTGVSFTVNGMDPNDTLYREYRALGMPVSVFIDANGVVSRVVNGLILLEQMETAFAEATAQSQTLSEPIRDGR